MGVCGPVYVFVYILCFSAICRLVKSFIFLVNINAKWSMFLHFIICLHIMIMHTAHNIHSIHNAKSKWDNNGFIEAFVLSNISFIYWTSIYRTIVSVVLLWNYRGLLRLFFFVYIRMRCYLYLECIYKIITILIQIINGMSYWSSIDSVSHESYCQSPITANRIHSYMKYILILVSDFCIGTQNSDPFNAY